MTIAGRTCWKRCALHTFALFLLLCVIYLLLFKNTFWLILSKYLVVSPFYQNTWSILPLPTPMVKRESCSVVMTASRGKARPIITDFSLNTTREPAWMCLNVTAVEHVNMFNLKLLRSDTQFVSRVCISEKKATNDTTFFRFLWPCIVSKLWSERENQQDATVRCLLSIFSQHVSGIIMPIFRRARRVLLQVVCCAVTSGVKVDISCNVFFVGC